MIHSTNKANTLTLLSVAFRSACAVFAAAPFLVSTWSTNDALAQGDAKNGEKVFKKCKVCHAVGPGAKNRVGPQLNGIIGSKAGTVEGFKYSKANLKAGADGWVWTEEVLLNYLKSPRKAMPGNKMAFPGVKKEQDRKDLVEYLKSFKSSSNAKAKPKTTKVAANTAASVKSAPAARGQAVRSKSGGLSEDIWVGGATPWQRPSAAPRATELRKDDAWYAQALFGLSKPYPVSFQFLEDQGGWFTPFNRPGMTGPYDLRRWHSR